MRIHALFAAVSTAILAACSATNPDGSPAGAQLVETRPDGARVYVRDGERFVIHSSTEADRKALESDAPLAAGPHTLRVNGLGCPLCATNIDKQLLRMEGVKSAKVDLGAGAVVVELAGPKTPSPKALREAVTDAGFTLAGVKPGA